MPLPSRKRRDDLVAALLRHFTAAFRRTRRGNLTQTYEGLCVTVFFHTQDYRWCIASPEAGARFSRYGYEDEESCISSLASELGLYEVTSVA